MSGALETIGRAFECSYADAVDPGMHSGCRYCAETEDARNALREVGALLRDLEAFVESETSGFGAGGKLLDRLDDVLGTRL